MAENKMIRVGLQKRITPAPFRQWLDIRVSEVNEDGIRISVPWRQEFVVNPKRKYAHGGILATLIDIATVEARVLNMGRTFSTAEAIIYDSEGRLLASERGVYHSPANR